MTPIWVVCTHRTYGCLLYGDQNVLMFGVIYHCGAYFNLLFTEFLKFSVHWMISFVITILHGN
jgi:hypothetical protein